MASKKFLYINRRPPHGSIYAHESLEVVLIGAAFEQDVTLAFIDDGVYQLMQNQDIRCQPDLRRTGIAGVAWSEQG
jgi:sulfur relay protein TusC/DsrF